MAYEQLAFAPVSPLQGDYMFSAMLLPATARNESERCTFLTTLGF